MVAMWVAAHAPERVEKLVLMNTAAKLGPPEVWSTRAESVRSGGMVAVTETVVARWFSPAFAASSPGVVAWVRRMLNTCPPEGYAACCGAIETMDLLPDLPAIVAPTLVVAGSDDPATPPPLLEEIAKGIAGSRYEVIPGGYHLSNVEHPAAVSKLILDFLA
jgi:3-oxoadipate enol-lactonase